MNVILTLPIDEKRCLQLITEADEDAIINLCNILISVHYKDENGLQCLSPSNVGFDLDDIAEHIQEGLDRKRMIPKEFGKETDLGFVWNEHWQKIVLAHDAGNPLPNWDWAGSQLFFLENNGSGSDSCITWLYNNRAGDIVMQISLAYPWACSQAPSPDVDISYQEWLPNYKILHTIILPRNIAKRWVKDLMKLYLQCKANCCCADPVK